MLDNWPGDGGRIARIEWRRHDREFGRSRSRRIGLVLSYCVVAVVLGAGALVVGDDLATTEAAPSAVGSLAATLAFGWVVVRSASLTHRRFEGLSSDALLTAVPVRTAVFGLVSFVFARVGVAIVLPTVGVAVGLAVGAGTPWIALSAVAAIAALAALAVAVGVAGRLAGSLVGRRLARGGLYRNLLVVFGWVPLVALWFLLRELSVSAAELGAWLEWLPLALLVDLAFLGADGTAGVEPLRALAAVGAVAVVVPALLGLTTIVARRLWVTESVGSTRSTTPSHSRSLAGGGRLERLLGGTVSQPTRTVARERLLAERRAPRGLLSTGYVLLFGALVGLPVFGALLGTPGFLLVVFGLGVAAGIVFTAEPIGSAYRVLPMLLTTVRGRQFVGGLVLASLLLGVPLVVLVVVPLGIVSDASLLETGALAVTGVALCACTATVNAAIELNVDRADLVPVSGFVTDGPVYSEPGWGAFSGLAKSFGIVSLVALPAFLGNARWVYERAPALGVPTAAVRLGALCCTIVLAVGVSRIAFRVAVARYRDYRLE
jgi:ABC-2 type transport system permease protein